MPAEPIARWTLNDIGLLDLAAWTTQLDALPNASFSVSLWAYVTEIQRTQVIAAYETPDASGWELQLRNGLLSWRYQQRMDVNTLEDVGVFAQIAGLERWYHVLCVADASQQRLVLYLNGVRTDDDPPAKPLETLGQGTLHIGGYTDPAGGHYDYTFGRNGSGLVDDVRIYDRALSADEVQALLPAKADAPHVAFTYATEQDDAPTNVSFSAEAVPDARGTIWTFGDGGRALGQAVTHRYEYAGHYRVGLTVIGPDYQQAESMQTLALGGLQQPIARSVFVNGTEGYACYRIPALVCTPSGALLAFAEGRLDACSDSTLEIHLVCKRSSDNGHTWGPLQVVARNLSDSERRVIHNPSPVVDRETGRVVVLYNKAEHNEWELAQGEGISRICCIISDDDGQTWHDETDVTAQVHQPNVWRVQRPTLGHAIQLRSGRLVHAGVFTTGERSVFQSQNYLFWSDDGGDTWRRGPEIPTVGLNEATLAELDDGSILINSRAYRDEKSVGLRAVTVAHFINADTVMYEPTRYEQTLIDPAVQASMLRYNFSDQAAYGKRSRLLFVNPAHPKARHNLTIRLSYDEGASWPISRTLDPGPASYSDVVVQGDGNIGVLYERGNQGGIVYTDVLLNWLESEVT